MSEAAPYSKLAYRIDEAILATGIGRTSIFEDIASGLLKTKKRGRSTLILTRDLEIYLQGLPDGNPATDS